MQHVIREGLLEQARGVVLLGRQVWLQPRPTRTRRIRILVCVSSTAGSPLNQKRCNLSCTHVQYWQLG